MFIFLRQKNCTLAHLEKSNDGQEISVCLQLDDDQQYEVIIMLGKNIILIINKQRTLASLYITRW